jgi:transcriptional regulator with XRE-family HTH domain
MKLNNLSASAFADEIGVQRSSVSHILSGRNKPSLEFIQKVGDRFPKVDLAWLINGTTGRKQDLEEAAPKQEGIEEVKTVEEKPVRPQQEEPVLKHKEGGKRVEKVLVFYSDGTFKEFLPS